MKVGRKIGLMGGSFDPVHHGHLLACREAKVRFQLDRLILLPAAQTPRKSAAEQAAGHHRAAMLRAATAGDPALEVSDFELDRGGVSYTVESVRHFRQHFPHDHLFWIIGADQVPHLERWRSIEEIAKMVEIIVISRPGHAIASAPAIPGLVLHHVDGLSRDLGSTALRNRLRQNQPVDGMIPPEVIVYIGQNELYQ